MLDQNYKQYLLNEYIFIQDKKNGSKAGKRLQNGFIDNCEPCKFCKTIWNDNVFDWPGAPITHNGVRVTILTTIENICSRTFKN